MKTPILYASLLLALLAACTSEEPNLSTITFAEDGPQKPADDWYLQRSWPDGQLSYSTYYRALQQARLEAQFKNESYGFDQTWTTVGPSNIGARINTIAIHPANDDIMLVGFARGGVWRTIDGGQNWLPIFDEQAYLAIADITFDPNNPNTIYVGTGDPNISGYPAIGDGIWRSTDGGDSWENIGPGDDFTIVSHVRVKPDDSNTLFVGTMGLPFVRNSDRGLYRSQDGGQTWEQSLFVADSAGIIDIVIHPERPEVIYVSSWNRIRTNQISLATGLDAKIWRSSDSGDTWEQLTAGLPTEEMSRIGLAVAPSNAEHLYAVYTAANYQLAEVYESNDGGDNWAPVLDTLSEFELSPDVYRSFGWYFGKIRVHPQNEDDITVLAVDLWRSSNGGFDWNMAAPIWWTYEVHADKHDLVWNSRGEAILATDGGLYRSSDDMLTWQDAENIPTTQFYRVAVNPHEPDWYYGGAQDNGSTGGVVADVPWLRIYGGDGFQMAFHPDSSNIYYAETQRGRINMTFDNGETWGYTMGGDAFTGERRNWDMPYFISTHDPAVLYTGASSMFRGERQPDIYNHNWQRIGPVLTDEPTAISSYHTITTVHESPVAEGLLYAGTADGNVWRHQYGDDSLDWVAIYQELPDRYVSEVKASPSYADLVYVSMSGYKDNEFSPYLFRSEDRGETWSSIAGDLPNLSINDLYILPNTNDSILFVATDGGVYGTSNAGENWHRLGSNMPFVPVYDLEYDPQDEELIAGTFARSIMAYPLDSILAGPPPIVSAREIATPDWNVRLWPNPFAKEESIQLQWDGMEPGDASLVWLNATGQVVGNYTVRFPSDKGQISAEVPATLPSGTYYLQLRKDQQQLVLPVVKK